VEASGPATVPVYEPSSHPDLERQYAQRSPEPSGDWNERLALLWRERRVLWRVAWKAVVVAVIVAYSLPKHYDGITKIVPGENQSGAAGLLGKLGAGSSLAGGLGLDTASLLGVKTPSAFYIEVMKSRTVQDRLIDRFDLRHRYSRIGRWFPGVYNTWIGRHWLEGDYYVTRKHLYDFTDFDEDKKTGVVTLTFTDYDRQTAANIANAYVEELNRVTAELNTSDAHRERLFLEDRLKQAKQELDQASLALSQFSSAHSVMDPQNQGRSMMDAAARIQGELVVAESELKALQQTYSDDNVRVRSTRARIGELQSQLKKLLGSPGTQLTGGDAPGSSLYPSMRALPLLGNQYGDLYRQAKIQETVYQFLTQQYEMAKIQEVKELPTVRVVDRAVPPERKSGPHRILIVLLSVLGGLVLASFWIIGKNSWEQKPGDHPSRLLLEQVSGDVHASMRIIGGWFR
jgi:uncharacterized protein involved in exopolysaccharide biosynthesis